MRRRNKKYVAVLLGGYPASLDKVMEIIGNEKTRLSFIYGFGVFVLFFESRLKHKEIDKIFRNNWLKNEVDMIYVFRNNKTSIVELRPELYDKVKIPNDAEKIQGDIMMLRDILYMLGVQYNTAMQAQEMMRRNMQGIQDEEEYEMTDHDILNQLLEKMKKTGYESLTPAELEFLSTYKNKYGKKNENGLD